MRPPTVIARRVFATREPVVVELIDEADEDVAAYLADVGSASVVAYPVRWQQDVLAAFGVEDTRPREWRRSVLPLLERVEPQVGAALAQAHLFAEREKALEQTRNLARMREELIANVSHELRTPLAAIVGSIKTLRRDDIDLDEARRSALLAVLEEQGDRLVLLTEDLLHLSRLSRGTQSLAPAPVELSEFVNRARDEVEIPPGRSLDVAIEDDVTVEADRNRMVQVVSNLVQNAIRHGQGRVTVNCSADEANAVIRVGDEGAGIDPGYEEEMFLAFSHRSDRSDSSGLGLSIARAIVEAHGGSLTYQPASGADTHQFVVRLPRATS